MTRRRGRPVISTRRRSLRRGTSAVVALLLLAVTVLIGIAAVSIVAVGRWPGWLDPVLAPVPSLAWLMPGVIVAAAVAILLGVLLIVLAWRPGKLRVATLTVPESPHVRFADITLSRRGVARLAAARADEIDGVNAISATATGRRVVLHIDTQAPDPAQVGQAVRTAVGQRFADASLQPAPRVRVATRTRAAS